MPADSTWYQQLPVYDSTQAIYSVMPAKTLPVSYWGLLWLGLTLLMLLSLGYWLLRKYRQRKHQTPTTTEPPRNFLKEALTALQKLEQQAAHLPDTRFYFQLTEIIKTFLEAILAFPAKEQTTREIVVELRNSELKARFFEELKILLEKADQAKFADAVFAWNVKKDDLQKTAFLLKNLAHYGK